MSNRKCLIFDIKKYAIHDGPGIRTTVFFKGCPLSCHWCHNPESISKMQHLIYNSKRCIGCRQCCDVCPEKALAHTPKGIQIDRSLCRICGQCADICPAEALEIQGKFFCVSEVAEIIKKDLIFYESSQGGVTFSGGEPLSQWEALLELLEACKTYELHTTVDTSGFSKWEILESVARRTDLFLYDLKMMDEDKHRRYTGVSNKTILSNLAKLSAANANIVIRIPLIPGINDGEKDLKEFGVFLSGLPAVKQVDILPYHDFHASKYDKLDIPYRMSGAPLLSELQVSRVVDRLQDYGLTVTRK